MVHLRFVKPRFDPDAFEVLMGNVNNYIIRKSNDINQKINDSTTVALYGRNNAKHRLFDEAYANDITFDKVRAIYLDRFADPADFEFFIIGDVQKNVLVPLLEKYIASIPTTKKKEQWATYPVSWIKDTIDRDIYLDMEDPKCTVKIAYKNDVEYSLKNELVAGAIGDILTLRYTETLREEEGGTYGASVKADVGKRPEPKGSISVSFDCNPDKVETLTDIVHQEIHKLANGDIQQDDLDKTLTNYLKQRQQDKDFNVYEMGLLTDYVIEGFNRNDPKNFEDIIYSMTVKDVQELAQHILDGANTYEIIFKPLKN
jgi:zinc protease